MSRTRRFARALRRFVRRIVQGLGFRNIIAYRHYKEVIRWGELVLKLREDKDALDEEFWAAQLRKSAHILDKGLQRGDYEAGHGQRLYKAAKDALARLQSPEVREDPSVVWARHKIQEYEGRQTHPGSFAILPLEQAGVSYENLRDLIRSRRSARKYSARPVADEDLRRIIEVVSWSPSSCNRQPAMVFATNDQSLVEKCMSTCAGATCFTGMATAFFCFGADIRVYEMPHELILPYVDVAMGAQNCTLAAHCLGISLTMLTWAQHTPEDDLKLRQLLDIPDHCLIVVNAVGGYPDGGTEIPPRKRFSSTGFLRGYIA